MRVRGWLRPNIDRPWSVQQMWMPTHRSASISELPQQLNCAIEIA